MSEFRCVQAILEDLDPEVENRKRRMSVSHPPTASIPFRTVESHSVNYHLILDIYSCTFSSFFSFLILPPSLLYQQQSMFVDGGGRAEPGVSCQTQ